MAEDPRELARRLAEEAKKRRGEAASKAAAPPPAPAPTPPERSLEERAAAGGRARSALEALESAREAERQRAATPVSPAPAATTPPTSNRHVSVAPAARTSAYAPSADRIVAELLPGARADRIAPIGNLDVFRALWRAHRARAVHERDGVLVATASVLLDAADRVAPGRLVEAKIAFGTETWAAWIDADRGALLGMARPADVYLSGS